ncbi:hypothetical protein CTEN210_12160 [Chaetoceros tenuissimus]|uniref:Altered inheritance of mitochondria protein 24, mitochondrial n=1 Tax=Chaetoceros tenuissimus TaxID=426638 RepID=A0AAD3HA70_9STRA|nr:hypothetical protein CTEN210_12160 [Chaetoceros tenuissimus]
MSGKRLFLKAANSKRISSHIISPSSISSRYLSSSSNLPSQSQENALTNTQESKPPAVPINFNTSSKIQGEESQILEVKLKPNQTLRAESGAMLFMTDGVEMQTSLGNSSSGISDGFKRMITGQNMFLSDYTYTGDGDTSGTVALGTAFPSKILRFSLGEYGNKLICQKGAYLASSMDVNIEMEFAKKFTAGFFGGEGFILQSLTGEGDVFVKAGGALVKRELKDGEVLRVSSGSLVAFTQDVEFDVQTVQGFKNVVFGGEGLFMTTLTGPGTVWLQGMAPDKMISEIARRVPSGGIGLGIPIGMGGGGSGAEGGAADTPVDAPVDGNGEAAIDESSSNTDLDGQEQDHQDLVAATDQAQQADRNATIASSGLDTSSSSDPESASSLFGDAAPKDDPSYAATSTDDPTNSFANESSTFPDMEDSSFSSESVDFGDDLTNDSQFDDFQQDETSFSTESSDLGTGEGGEEEGSGILGMIWDFLTDDD